VRPYPTQLVFAVIKTFAEIGGEADNGGWGSWGRGIPWIVDVQFMESSVAEVASTEH
jgi:hypothetical protein